MPGLLVADDTPIVRSTVTHIVAQEKLGIQPVIEAGNGEEAVELARQVRPDIVLMDIKMPGLDGLQAAAIIRQELPATKIIILTAYDEFPYVQKALQLGAIDFLLKPVRPAKLAEVLIQAWAQVQAERQQQQEVVATRTYLQKTLPMIEATLVDQLIRGLTTDRVAIEVSLKHLGKKISWPAVLVADVDSMEALGPDEAANPLADLTPRMLGEAGTFLVGYSAPGRVIAIVSTDHNLAAVDQMRQLGTVIQRALEARLGLSVVVGLGRRYTDLGSIPLSYAEASLACRHRVCREKQPVIHIDDINSINCREKLAYPVQLEREILDKVRQAEVKACGDLLNQMLDYLVYQFRQRPEIIRNRLAELMALVARTVMEVGAVEVDVLDLSHQLTTNLSTLTGVVEMRAWAHRSLTELTAATSAPTAARGDAAQLAVDYIHQHQQRPDLTLNEVAEAVNLSSSHLAHLLKERLGVSYKSYLTSLRIEAAKRLLRTTDLTITAIAEAAGYQNTTNFYRLFQRETGLTPAAYRRSL